MLGKNLSGLLLHYGYFVVIDNDNHSFKALVFYHLFVACDRKSRQLQHRDRWTEVHRAVR